MGNILYTAERTSSFEKRYEAEYLPEMYAYFLRFPTYRTVERSSMGMISRMSKFFDGRQQKLIKDLSHRYTLGRAKTVKVTSDKDITLNGLSIQSGFEGRYFNNCELILKADSEVTWTVKQNGNTTEVNDSKLVIKMTGDTEIKAE